MNGATQSRELSICDDMSRALTVKETDSKYQETSAGGLALSVTLC